MRPGLSLAWLLATGPGPLAPRRDTMPDKKPDQLRGPLIDTTPRPLGPLASQLLSQELGEPVGAQDKWQPLPGDLLGEDSSAEKTIWIAGLLKPPRGTAEALDDDLTRLWLDLWKYDEKQPSERARLARNLIAAAQQLLRDEQNENVRATPASKDGRTKLASGAAGYLKKRGQPGGGVSLSWSSSLAIRDVRRIIKIARILIAEKNPEHPEAADDATARAELVARIISKTLWDHEDWYTFRKLLKQKNQPTDRPDSAQLAKKIKDIFKGKYAPTPTPPPPDAWPDLAARVLAAAVRVAGCGERFADNILRGERGTPKGEQSGSVDSPRKQSGSVDSALLPPQQKPRG